MQSRTEGFAPLQINLIHDCPGVSDRKLCFGRYRSQNHSAMPLENLEAYGSDFGSSGHASNSGDHDEAKTLQYDTDANTTEAESSDESLTTALKRKIRRAIRFGPAHASSKSKRQRSTPDAQSQVVVGCSDSDDNERGFSDRDDLFGHSGRGRRCGFKRPRIQCELVSSWNKDQVSPDDYQGEIARNMAKSMHDAKA
jgi:hypothetical protein